MGFFELLYSRREGFACGHNLRLANVKNFKLSMEVTPNNSNKKSRSINNSYYGYLVTSSQNANILIKVVKVYVTLKSGIF